MVEKLITLVRDGHLFIFDPARNKKLQSEAIELICREHDKIRINLKSDEEKG